MSFEPKDRDEQLLLEGIEPAPVFPQEARASDDHALRARVRGPQQRPSGETPRKSGEPGVVEAPPLYEDHPSEQAEGGKSTEKRRRSFLRRHPFASAMGSLLALLIAAGGYVYWDYTSHFETTDDAFIAARQFSIAPKVSGYITAVPVTDNQHVAAGAVVARIDDRDYRAALDQAQAQVAGAEASIQNIDAQINVQEAQINASQAQVDQAQAALVFAQQQATRYGYLANRGVGSVQNAQQYSSQLDAQQATLKSAQANLKVAQRQVESLKAQRDKALADLAAAKAQRDQAQLNLSYTNVTATQAGHIANLSAAVGQYVQAGTALSNFVPDNTWITANFKETQLDRMRPGEPVTIRIDAYPERAIEGHLASVQYGSGTAFSLLPPENATGNYVKIVQRVPVKIIMDNPPVDVALGPGMSVEPTVRVNPAPSLYERLRSWL
ncbi:MAG TPA: HlyD family secretion protein [Methylovirgula sp.]|nr:HlyD family secretion protein [Methylovirgula sp.]